VWEKAIPQFNLGHLDVLKEAKAGLAAAGCDGLFLVGCCKFKPVLLAPGSSAWKYQAIAYKYG
jgi:hypothetical protein